MGARGYEQEQQAGDSCLGSVCGESWQQASQEMGLKAESQAGKQPTAGRRPAVSVAGG